MPPGGVEEASGTQASGKSASSQRANADGGGLARRHDRSVIRENFIPLVRCRECNSSLLQPIAVAGPIEGSSLVARSCPDCGRRDIVVAEDNAVQEWLLRDARIAAWMIAAADGIAAERAPAGVPPTPAGR